MTAEPSVPDAVSDAPRPAEQVAKAPVRALFVQRDLDFHGGVPRCVLYFANARPPGAVDMHVVSCRQPTTEMSEALQETGVTPLHIGDDDFIGAIRRIRTVIREQRIDVVIASAFKPYVLAKLAGIGTGVSTVYWIHSIHMVITGWLRQRIFRFLARRDRLVFVSHAVGEAHRPPDHQGDVSVVYNGVNDPMIAVETWPYGKSMRSVIGLPDDAVVFGYIAEFVPWKDHATLLGAFEIVQATLPQAHLLLIGTGQDWDRHRAEVAGKPWGDRVHFLGARTDARRLMGIMDVYVHPSRGEGFGLAVVEAMLARRPVIVADSGACREYVDGKTNGLMFDAGDVDHLARQMLLLAGDRAMRRVFGDAAREYCLDHFAPERFVDGLLQVLRASVGAGKG